MEFMHHDLWHDALFLHYEADPTALQALLPKDLVVDTFKGKAYVGVVALSEIGIRPTFLPRWLGRLFALSHYAVNVRTYVRPVNDSIGQPGIYFLTLDCSHILPALGARLLFHLPYRLASMIRGVWNDGSSFSFQSRRWRTTGKLEVEWEISPNEATTAAPQDSLAFFLVERYCLYNRAGTFLRLLARAPNLWRGSITHAPWPLQTARVTMIHNTVLDAIPGMNEAILSKVNPSAHFSPGISDIHFYYFQNDPPTVVEQNMKLK